MSQTILLIDHNLLQSRGLVQRLRKQNKLVLVAQTGNDAIHMASTHHPDIILIDFNLPDIPGDLVMRKIRQHQDLHHTPFVMLLNDASEQSRNYAKRMGCDGFMLKGAAGTDITSTMVQFS